MILLIKEQITDKWRGASSGQGTEEVEHDFPLTLQCFIDHTQTRVTDRALH